MHSTGPGLSPNKKLLVLVLSGANLMIIQFAMIRTLSSILRGVELMIFLVTLAYFAGYSAGCHFSDRLTPRRLRILGLAQWITHLTFPFSLRLLAGALVQIHLMKFVLPIVLFAGAFWASCFYSVLLPRLMNESASTDEGDFASFYGWEVLGAMGGLAATAIFSPIGPLALMTLYHASLAAIMAMLLPWKKLWIAILAAPALYAAAGIWLEPFSVAKYYRWARDVNVSRVLFSADTAYQRVEIFDDEEESRHLYLDGIRHYGNDSLSEFNYLIAGLPAALLKEPDVVVVGSGSFEAVHQALPTARSVTSVELDPVVASVGADLLASPLAPEDAAKWSVIIDDAKHYFGVTPRKVDLVSMDIAGPMQRQVGLLYTDDFYRLVLSRLREGGVITTPLNGDFSKGHYVSSRIVVTLLSVFKDVFVVVRPHRSSFAIAGNNARFTKADVLRLLTAEGARGLEVYDRADIERRLQGRNYHTISMRHMDLVLRGSIHRLRDMYLSE